jgi:hypothetical protein
MSSKNHLVFVQLLLVCFENAKHESTDNILIDEPIGAQMSISVIDMVKVKMLFQYYANWPIADLNFTSEMSLIKMADEACRIESNCFFSV